MEENIKPQKTAEAKSARDIFIIRSIVCVIILLTTLFVRFNNRYIYDSLKFWYSENILEEKYSLSKIKENIGSAYYSVKDRVLSLISNLKSVDK